MTFDTARVERSAPPAADRAVRGVLQRCGDHPCPATGCVGDDERTTLQRAAGTEAPVTDVPPIVHEVLRSTGAPLDAETRADMEPRFGHDFSGVRVHTNATAARSAAAVQALAYTVGRDVVFGVGQYAPSSAAGRRLLAHELTHVVQQQRDVPIEARVVARQAMPAPVPARPPMRPPLRVIPGGRAEPGGRPFPTGETGPRYAPDPFDDSFEAAVERANIRSYAERERIQQERPVATLDRGGQPPDFIRIHGTRNYSWIGGVGGGGSVTVRDRRFHVLDAIEYAVGRATTEEHLQAIIDLHVSVVGLLNTAIDVAARRRQLAPLTPSFTGLGDEPVYLHGFDPGGVTRLQVFEAAVAHRVQQVPALAQSRLIPRTRRRGGCRLEPMSPLGDDPMSILYCHLATRSPYSYRITIETATGGLTRRWAEIDALRGNTWYECKCGYEALLTGAARGEGVARAVLDKLDRQVLNHLDIARTCGLEYRYIVSNDRVADILRSRWFGNVVIDVVPFEGCD